MKEVSCEDSPGLVKVGSDVRNKGSTVVFPTDTVYGLGSNPFLEQAVEMCFKLKGRSETKAVPVLFSDISTIAKYVEFDSTADNLARAFWPGGLTLVLRLRKGVTLSERITKNGTMAVRIPGNACCLELIEACGGSLMGTSANRSGEKPLSDPDDKRLQIFASNCDYFVRGECSLKISSTVLLIEPQRKIKILREGAVPTPDIIRQLGKTSMADLS
jgi:L-threonylcarbamoyladenylate synthase